MNGFTNAVLSLLLGWLRALLNSLWNVISGEGGGALFSFFSSHWKLIFLLLCVGGFVIDRMVYLFRWRPYYVWATHWERFRRRLRGESLPSPKREPAHHRVKAAVSAASHASYEPSPVQTFSAAQGYAPAQTTAVFAPPALAARPPQPQTYAPPVSYAPAQSTSVFAPPVMASPSQRGNPLETYAPQTPAPLAAPIEMTHTYAPLMANTPLPSCPVEPVAADLQPVFDEEIAAWSSPAGEVTRVMESVSPFDLSHEPFLNPAKDMQPSFGSARPEPAAYLQDVQAGFAPPPSPEELYAMREPVPTAEPVHPGLDLDTFHQNIGLAPKTIPAEQEEWDEEPPPDFPNTTFVPYYESVDTQPSQRNRNPLSALAKKARDLVGVSDEDNQPTLRDLKPPVNMKNAFHAPVFPRKPNEGGGN